MDFYISSEGGYEPVWGPPTSTMNFCEEDYQFTPYVAELFNTLTNITYIGLGVIGILNNHRLGEKSIAPQLPYLTLINLGIASSVFHSSLKYYTQMADEFSMLIATFVVCYRLLSFSQTTYSPAVLATALCSLMGFVVVAQISTGSSTVQQIVFTGMAYWLWATCFRLISNKAINITTRRKMRLVAISGIGFFISGHLCWMTDFYACGSLRSMRHNIGMPWAAILELHGFWHILTGVGVYIFMVLVDCLRFASVPGGTNSGNIRLSAAGTWPFMVYLETGIPEKTEKTGRKKGKERNKGK